MRRNNPIRDWSRTIIVQYDDIRDLYKRGALRVAQRAENYSYGSMNTAGYTLPSNSVVEGRKILGSIRNHGVPRLHEKQLSP